MNYQTLFSGLALLMLIACVASRAVMLRKRGIRAMVFGETDKRDFVLVAVLLAIVYAAVARSLGLPMWGVLLKPFWESAVPGWVGVGLCALSIVCFILSLISFGDSFRVGIDEKTSSKLMTVGMFAISRNPVYLSILIMLAGQFLIHRNIVITAAVIFFPAMIHRQILREEVFLKKTFGEEYADYCGKVRRYI